MQSRRRLHFVFLALTSLSFNLTACDSGTSTPNLPVNTTTQPVTATTVSTIARVTTTRTITQITTLNTTSVATPTQTSRPSVTTQATNQAKFPVWVELGPGGTRFVRAVTTAGTCPQAIAIFGASAQAMQPRAKPSSPNYPVLVCEASIPAGTNEVSVGGQNLKLLNGVPKKIAVIGDTGCRIETGLVQACNNPQQWPLQKIAQTIAAWQPDLIIHVGDYLYREEACPAGNEGCTGSPFGYNWNTWNADVFTPLAALLPTAPWIFVRGNHEICSRAGDGWFRFLDPHPLPASCQDYTEPYQIPVGNLQLLIMDVSAAGDTTVPPEQVTTYARQFGELGKLAGSNAWLITHKPLWGILNGKTGTVGVGTATLDVASLNKLPAGVKLIISGHIHLGQELGFVGGRVPQLIMGAGGTLLDAPVTSALNGQFVVGATLASGKVLHENGFMGLEPDSSDWTATIYDRNGKPQVSCKIAGLNLTCTP